MVRVAVALAIAGLFFTSQVARADIPINLVAQHGGVCCAIAVSGNRAYIGMGPRLAVLDVSSPSNPSLLGVSEVLPDIVIGAAVSGNYAYVTAGTSGLYVINVANPCAPVRVGVLDTTGSARGVAVSGNYAYVADDTAGLQVIDVSNPASPARVGGYDTTGNAYGVAVAGSYAYVADNLSGLQVINISNPASPTRVGGYNTSGQAYGVCVSGSYAYVADCTSGLQIINISNPASPTRVGGLATQLALGVVVSGSYAYVADHDGGIRVINVSNPAAPNQSGSYGGFGWAIAAEGTTVYVAQHMIGLGILNAANPTYPAFLADYKTGYPGCVAMNGSYVYTGNASDGNLCAFSVANPASPTPYGCGYTCSMKRITIAGNYAYETGESGFCISNISNPASPVYVGSCSLGTFVYGYGVAVAGNYAYIGAGSAGLQCINIANPAAPVKVGSYDTAGSAGGVAVSGGYAYLADGSAGLQVIDISNPASPTRVGGYDTNGSASAVALAGAYAYVADGSAGLQVINISNPASPTWVGGCDTPGSASRIVVSGNYAYLTDVGLQIIDISNPAAPALAGAYDTIGAAYDIVQAGDYAYLADRQAGLVVLGIGLVPPLGLASIVPNSAVGAGSVNITDLSGTGFQAGATVKLTRSGQSDIPATGVNVVSASRITCTFNLTGAVAGQWNVVVTNPGAQSATLANGFTVTYAPPSVIACAPTSALVTSVVNGASVTGTGFRSGATVLLRKPGEADIAATGVSVVSSTQINCNFAFLNGTRGLWDIVATNNDGQSACLAEGFALQLPDTAPSGGMSMAFTANQAASIASIATRFRVWGRVTILDSTSFDLDDGSRCPIRVRAPGYTDLVDGSCVAVTGTLDTTASVRTIISTPAQITKYQ